MTSTTVSGRRIHDLDSPRRCQSMKRMPIYSNGRRTKILYYYVVQCVLDRHGDDVQHQHRGRKW